MLNEKSIENIKNLKNKILELVKETFWEKHNIYFIIKNILDKDFNKITENDLVVMIDMVVESDFIINSIKNHKNFIIEKWNTIIKIWELIPFFSVRYFIEKKFKDIIDESNKNIEFYKQINYNIFWIFISITIAILWINNWISSFTIFLLWICGFLFLISIWYFIKNYIKIAKNNYRLEIIENFIKIFEKWNLNEKSLDFIIKLLEKRKNEKQNKILEEIFKYYSINEEELFEIFYMNKNQIKKLIKNWNLIWWHTENHILLSKYNENFLKKEILESNKYLEKEFNIKIKNFAIPYWTKSSYNDNILSILKNYWIKNNFIVENKDFIWNNNLKITRYDCNALKYWKFFIN